MTECACQNPLFHYRDFDSLELGSDSTNGDVSLHTCKKCSTKWVGYLVEWPHFSKSTRWYRTPITAEEALTLTAENAKDYIEKQEWCFAGGDYYREIGIHKKTKPIKVV